MKKLYLKIIYIILLINVSYINIEAKKINTQDNKEVIIAIIDTGIDYKHPDLKDKIWINNKEIPGDGIDNDGNGYIDDINGWNFYNDDNILCHYVYDIDLDKDLAHPKDNDDHGTHVAGIIAAAPNLQEGYKGIASNVNIKIMPIKINGGTSGLGTIKNAIDAIKYATSMGADICNLSWGTDVYSKELEQVMRESNMLFIAAAGNTGTNNNKKPIYPASFDLDNLISVTFVDNDLQLTENSNFGLGKVDIAAFGQNIKSTIVGGTDYMSGSSMATPYVTSVAAMVYENMENIYPQDVKKLIVSNIIKADSLKAYINYPGVPDIDLILSKKSTLKKDTTLPKLKVSSKFVNDKIQLKLVNQNKEESKIRTIKYLTGKREIADFNKGMRGTPVSKELYISKAGNYTFYISDYAGNENVIHYNVKDDKKAPTIQASYNISYNLKKKTINVRVVDDLSGVKRVKYLKGIKSKEDFLAKNAGKEIILNKGKASFTVPKAGEYTIFAMDNRGNISLLYINVHVIKAEAIKIVSNRITIKQKESQLIRTFLKPSNTTDKVKYSLSEKDVVTIDQKGLMQAKKPGSVVITAITSNGARAICEVIVV